MRGSGSARCAILIRALVLSLAVPLGCKGCGGGGAVSSAVVSDAALDAGGKLQPVDVEIDMPIGELPEGLEFGPAEPKPWLRHVGTVDIEDQYASVVMITLKGLDAPLLCSGVLISHRVALTAASCVCPHHDGQASSCVKRVSVTTVVHDGESSAPWRQRRLRNYEGSVRTHSEQTPSADPLDFRATRSDLAVIVLDEPVQEHFEEARLAGSEVREGEELIMAGYGQDEAMGGERGARYYRKNKVTRAPGRDDDRILYEQRGTYVYNGFAGGPCFREERGRRWLVGIAGIGSAEGLSCTSLHVHRKWVRGEMREFDPPLKKGDR